jgi:hypothetical protein
VASARRDPDIAREFGNTPPHDVRHAGFCIGTERTLAPSHPWGNSLATSDGAGSRGASPCPDGGGMAGVRIMRLATEVMRSAGSIRFCTSTRSMPMRSTPIGRRSRATPLLSCGRGTPCRSSAPAIERRPGVANPAAAAVAVPTRVRRSRRTIPVSHLRRGPSRPSGRRRWSALNTATPSGSHTTASPSMVNDRAVSFVAAPAIAG